MNVIEVVKKACGRCAPAEEKPKYKPWDEWPPGQRFRYSDESAEDFYLTKTSTSPIPGEDKAWAVGSGGKLYTATTRGHWSGHLRVGTIIPIDANGNTIPPDPAPKKSWDDYPAGSVFRCLKCEPDLMLKTREGGLENLSVPASGGPLPRNAEIFWDDDKYEHLPHAAIIRDARVLDGIDGIEVVPCH